ncbi:RimK family alpha-L-glutamate ligase [Agromyces sp. NPDC058110]|uniref:ATP-grasp domain-containing protein n=1 Tax=Agromyces sp. NPDC058110 TaxID=3346345 RepID=UPI0036D90574
MRVAVLRCGRLPSFVTWEIADVESLFDDDRRLIDALRDRGVDAEPVAWSADGVDWDAYDVAVLRSTWDYVDRTELFLEVMTTIDRSGCTLLNPLDAVHWNVDKRYLDDLADWGVPIVPVVRGLPAEAAALVAEVESTGWTELVLKPSVGVGGAGVVRTDAAGLPRLLASLPRAAEVMVQPFAPSVLDEGELSFVSIGGSQSHVLRKRPAPGDFRAHGIYGGSVERSVASPGDVAEVEAMLSRLPFDLHYARVDVVRLDGRLAVLELELVEPMLYLDRATGAAERLAEATIARSSRS